MLNVAKLKNTAENAKTVRKLIDKYEIVVLIEPGEMHSAFAIAPQREISTIPSLEISGKKKKKVWILVLSRRIDLEKHMIDRT
eukprot:Awhi_evm1s7967